MRNARGELRGFTLIEVIIVVFVILILAAVFMPTRTRWGPRSQVSRVRSDMRTLATAIGAYHSDYRSYPAMRPAADLTDAPSGAAEMLGEMRAESVMTVESGSGSVAGLTTPVAYLSSLDFADPFHRISGVQISYYTDGHAWVLYSCGPDGDFDLDAAVDFDGAADEPGAGLIAKMYDPTNGSMSDGDVIRVGWKPGESPFDR